MEFREIRVNRNGAGLLTTDGYIFIRRKTSYVRCLSFRTCKVAGKIVHHRIHCHGEHTHAPPDALVYDFRARLSKFAKKPASRDIPLREIYLEARGATLSAFASGAERAAAAARLPEFSAVRSTIQRFRHENQAKAAGQRRKMHLYPTGPPETEGRELRLTPGPDGQSHVCAVPGDESSIATDDEGLARDYDHSCESQSNPASTCVQIQAEALPDRKPRIDFVHAQSGITCAVEAVEIKDESSTFDAQTDVATISATQPEPQTPIHQPYPASPIKQLSLCGPPVPCVASDSDPIGTTSSRPPPLRLLSPPPYPSPPLLAGFPSEPPAPRSSRSTPTDGHNCHANDGDPFARRGLGGRGNRCKRRRSGSESSSGPDAEPRAPDSSALRAAHLKLAQLRILHEREQHRAKMRLYAEQIRASERQANAFDEQILANQEQTRVHQEQIRASQEQFEAARVQKEYFLKMLQQ